MIMVGKGYEKISDVADRRLASAAEKFKKTEVGGGEPSPGGSVLWLANAISANIIDLKLLIYNNKCHMSPNR